MGDVQFSFEGFGHGPCVECSHTKVKSSIQISSVFPAKMFPARIAVSPLDL